MLRRLFVVLQFLGLIPILIWWFFWVTSSEYDRSWKFPNDLWLLLLSLIPYGFVILGKWIIYGKFHIYKIGEGEENKLKDSSRKDDSKNSNQDFDEPPFPDGEWENGVFHGQGTYTSPDVSTYVGEWKDGERDGQGTLTYPSGRNYDGEWKNGKEHGQGTYSFPNGSKFEGEFRDGKWWNGAEYDKNGNITGKWVNGEKHK